jgi:tripartite-type tricarboxylate transporter receptor subunit TctC
VTKIIHRRTALAMGVAAGVLAPPTFVRGGRAQGAYAVGKTARIVVPFAAGGTSDRVGRVVAEILTGAMARTFIIENNTDSSGNVCAEIVAKALPDGLTLLLGTVGTAVTNQYIYKTLSYDSVGSFAPIALVGELANVIVVHSAFPVRTLQEFVDYSRAQGPKTVSYGSPGIGSTGHLAMEYLQNQAGIELKHVERRSRSQLIKDLLAGRILAAMDNLPPYLQHIQSGTLRALGVTSAKRWFAAPYIPTIAEQDYSGFDATLWWYVAAPAGTRIDVVRKLSDEIVAGISAEPAIRRIRGAGASELPGNSEELARYMVAENKKWKYVIDAAKLQRQ